MGAVTAAVGELAAVARLAYPLQHGQNDNMTGRPAARWAASAQLTGAREQQEDALAIHAPAADSGVRAGEVLLVLADGMGGHAGGEVASRLVADSFCAAYQDSNASVADALRSSLDLANEALADAVASEPSRNGMGTTLVCCVIKDDRLYWISVGDSPLWLFRDMALQRLNADHSMVPLLDDMVRTGLMSPEEARKDPRRNLLRSALAGKTVPLIDHCVNPLQLQTGDLVMLASDGVETLGEAELTALLQHSDALALDALAAKLLAGVEDAAARHQDNASIILYRY
jgi:serine/threonine protein phosphatase PrpC